MSDLDGGLSVYVPTAMASRTTLSHIWSSSGIVGSFEHGHVRIDYEGVNGPVTWADRIRAAARRHESRYPTVARSWVPEHDLVLVGAFLDEEYVVPLPWRVEDIHRWLPDYNPRELEVTR